MGEARSTERPLNTENVHESTELAREKRRLELLSQAPHVCTKKLHCPEDECSHEQQTDETTVTQELRRLEIMWVNSLVSKSQTNDDLDETMVDARSVVTKKGTLEAQVVKDRFWHVRLQLETNAMIVLQLRLRQLH